MWDGPGDDLARSQLRRCPQRHRRQQRHRRYDKRPRDETHFRFLPRECRTCESPVLVWRTCERPPPPGRRKAIENIEI